MILHVGLLGWLIWYGPVRDIVLERGKPKREALIRGKELEKVIEQMQLSVAEELAQRIELLKSGQDRMATNFNTLNAHFQPFEDNQKATAMLRFEKYATALKADQEALMQVLITVQGNKQYDAASLAGQDKVPGMISALDEVRRGVLLLTSDESIAQMHAQAETAMFEVEKPLRDIGNLLGRHRQLTREIEESKVSVRELEPIMIQSQKVYDKLKEAYDKLDNEIKDMREKINTLRKVNSKERDNDLIKKISEDVRDKTKQLGEGRKELSNASRKAKDDQNKFNREKQRLEDRQRAFDGLNIEEKLPVMLKTAMDQLTLAMTLESQVIEQVYSSQKDKTDEKTQSKVPAS